MYARDAASAASGKQDGAVLEVALTLDDALLAGAEAEECVCRVRTLPDGDYAVSAADGAGWGAEQTVGLEWASAALQYATLGEGAEPHVVQLHSAPIAGSGGGEWKVQYCGAVGAVQARPVRAAELEQLMPEPVVLDTYKVRPHRRRRLCLPRRLTASGALQYVMSPMPGSLVSLAVEEGSEVVEGEPIGVLEAMKMQNVMKAERSGTVKSVLV